MHFTLLKKDETASSPFDSALFDYLVFYCTTACAFQLKFLRKLLFNCWLLNLLLSLALHLGFRLIMSNTDHNEATLLGNFSEMVKIVLDLQWIAIFAVAMIVCSTTYFLNLNDRIRNNALYSFLTFLGIPIAIFLFFFIQRRKDFQTIGFEMIKFWQSKCYVAIIYMFCITLLFYFFRRKLKKV